MSTVLDALRKAERYDGPGRGGRLPPGDLPPTRPPRRRGPRRLRLVIAGVVLVAAFAGGIELASRDDKDESASKEGTEVASAPTEQVATEKGEADKIAQPPSDASGRKMDDGESRLKAARQAALEKRSSSDVRKSAHSQMQSDRRKERHDKRPQPAVVAALPSQQPADPNTNQRLALLEQFRAKQTTGADEQRSQRQQHDLQREQREQMRQEREQRLEQRASRSSASASPPPPPQMMAAAKPLPAAAPPPPRAVQPSLREPTAPDHGAGLPTEEPLEASIERPATGGEPSRSQALRRPPSSAPRIRINILQWSLDPTRRFAYMSVEGGGGMTQVREGETFEGLTVKRIMPEMVEFGTQDSTFLLRAN